MMVFFYLKCNFLKVQIIYLKIKKYIYFLCESHKKKKKTETIPKPKTLLFSACCVEKKELFHPPPELKLDRVGQSCNQGQRKPKAKIAQRKPRNDYNNHPNIHLRFYSVLINIVYVCQTLLLLLNTLTVKDLYYYYVYFCILFNFIR